MKDPSVWKLYQSRFDKWVDDTSSNPRVKVMRSRFSFASPIEVTVDGEKIRYSDRTDREKEQKEHFLKMFMEPFVEERESKYGGIDDTGFEAMQYAYALKEGMMNKIAD